MEKITDAFLKRIGRGFASGVISELMRLGIAVLIVVIVSNYIRDTDATDDSWFDRSGVKIITDRETGCQYLMGQDGGVIRREGKPCTGSP